MINISMEPDYHPSLKIISYLILIKNIKFESLTSNLKYIYLYFNKVQQGMKPLTSLTPGPQVKTK